MRSSIDGAIDYARCLGKLSPRQLYLKEKLIFPAIKAKMNKESALLMLVGVSNMDKDVDTSKSSQNILENTGIPVDIERELTAQDFVDDPEKAAAYYERSTGKKGTTK